MLSPTVSPSTDALFRASLSGSSVYGDDHIDFRVWRRRLSSHGEVLRFRCKCNVRTTESRSRLTCNSRSELERDLREVLNATGQRALLSRFQRQHFRVKTSKLGAF
jgi:hypothetical protein